MKLIEDFRNLPRSRQKGIAALAAIMVLLAVITVGIAIIDEFIQSEEQQGASAPNEALPARTGQQGDMEGAGEPGDDTRVHYEGAQLEFVSRLTSAKWKASSSSLEFDVSSFKETSEAGKAASTKSYVVKSVKETTTFEQNDGWEAIVEIEGDYTSLSLVPSQPREEDSLVPFIVACDKFTASSSYLQSLSDSFSVSSIDNALVQSYIGSDSLGEPLKAALQTFCSRSLPTASEAAWTGSCMFDFELEAATLYFETNNASKSQVAATFSIASNDWTVKQA